MLPESHGLAGIRFALGSRDKPVDPWLSEAVARAGDGVLIGKPPAIWSRRYTPVLPVPLWRRPATSSRGLKLRFLKGAERRQPRQLESTTKKRFDQQRLHKAPRVDDDEQTYTLYPEWDNRSGCMLDDWCRVFEATVDGKESRPNWAGSEIVHLSRVVRRQFEALRQTRSWQRHLDYGDDLDIGACVDAFGDRRGCGFNTSGLYRSKTEKSRDLSVAILIDTSRSTDKRVGGRRVLEIAQQSMLVLTEALGAIGDSFALYGFSSDSRLRININKIKCFDDVFDEQLGHRLTAVRASDYTRMGAAVRHVGAALMRQPTRQKLLLVLTDGQPTDPTDQYVGEYALEDTRRAFLDLRSHGVHPFGLTIDRRGHNYLPRIFGRGRYVVYSDVRSLPRLLPSLYVRLTGPGA